MLFLVSCINYCHICHILISEPYGTQLRLFLPGNQELNRSLLRTNNLLFYPAFCRILLYTYSLREQQVGMGFQDGLLNYNHWHIILDLLLLSLCSYLFSLFLLLFVFILHCILSLISKCLFLPFQNTVHFVKHRLIRILYCLFLPTFLL